MAPATSSRRINHRFPRYAARPGDDLQARVHLREELEPLLLAVERLPLPEAPACLDHPGIEQGVVKVNPRLTD